MSKGKYSAYRRSNEKDQPRPAVVEHTWVILKPDGRVLNFMVCWPDTASGQLIAEAVADELNSAYERGRRAVQNDIADVLGLREMFIELIV